MTERGAPTRALHAVRCGKRRPQPRTARFVYSGAAAAVTPARALERGSRRGRPFKTKAVTETALHQFETLDERNGKRGHGHGQARKQILRAKPKRKKTKVELLEIRRNPLMLCLCVMRAYSEQNEKHNCPWSVSRHW